MSRATCHRRAGPPPAAVRIAVVAALAVAAAPSPQRPAPAPRLTRTLTWRPDVPIAVRATVGEISITGSDRVDLEVDLRRTGPGASDATLPIAVDDGPDEVSVSAVQPGGATDPAVQSIIAIRAPAGARVAPVTLTEGRLTLVNLTGEVTARLARGDVRATGLAGRVRLETGIGNLELERIALSPDGLLRLRVFNGDIRLEFSRRPTNARILALVLNGDITSDIPLQRTDRFGPRFAGATLGRGESVVSLDVVTGSITIKAPTPSRDSGDGAASPPWTIDLSRF